MTPTQSEDFLSELKDLLDYAIENRNWLTVEEVREMIYEELGLELFNEEKEEEEY